MFAPFTLCTSVSLQELTSAANTQVTPAKSPDHTLENELFPSIPASATRSHHSTSAIVALPRTRNVLETALQNQTKNYGRPL